MQESPVEILPAVNMQTEVTYSVLHPLYRLIRNCWFHFMRLVGWCWSMFLCLIRSCGCGCGRMRSIKMSLIFRNHLRSRHRGTEAWPPSLNPCPVPVRMNMCERDCLESWTVRWVSRQTFFLLITFPSPPRNPSTLDGCHTLLYSP